MAAGSRGFREFNIWLIILIIFIIIIIRMGIQIIIIRKNIRKERDL